MVAIRRKSKQIRLSFHPDHFVCLASKDINVIKNSILNIVVHNKIMDYFMLDENYNNPINIHVGGAYNNKKEAIDKKAAVSPSRPLICCARFRFQTV